MIHDIVMPQLGITMTEGFVMKWLKEVGDPIERESRCLLFRPIK